MAFTGQILGIMVLVTMAIMVMDSVIDTGGDTLIIIISMILGTMLVFIIHTTDHIIVRTIDQIIVLITDLTIVRITNLIMVRIMQKRLAELVKMIVVI